MRYIPLILAFIGLALPQFLFAASFFDVSGTVYEPAFTHLAQKNVVQGYDDGSGQPHKPLIRVEGAKVTMKLVDPERVEWYERHLPPFPLFPDQDLTAWYTPPVEAAFEAGVLKGHDDGYLRPGGMLTVEQALAMLLRGYNLDQPADAALLSPDIQNQDGTWFTGYVNTAIEKNLIMPGSRLKLGRAITRGQFFDIAFRLDSVMQNGGVAFEGGVAVEQPTYQNIVNIPQAVGLPEINIPMVASHPYASEKSFAISMPTLGIQDLAVTHPYDVNDLLSPLQHGVGHLFSYPGGQGKIMIFGHSSGYPWDVSEYTKIFRQVNRLQIGEKIYVTYDGKVHTYEVTHHQTIDAADTSPFHDEGAGEELILYTCWPPDSISQRYLVHAVPVETVALQ